RSFSYYPVRFHPRSRTFCGKFFYRANQGFWSDELKERSFTSQFVHSPNSRLNLLPPLTPFPLCFKGLGLAGCICGELFPAFLRASVVSIALPITAMTAITRDHGDYVSSGKSSSLNSASALPVLSASAARNCTRRILPEIVFGRSTNSSRRTRLYGSSVLRLC